MPIEESIAKLDAATAALIHSVEVNESMVDTVTERLDDQDDIIEALPEVSVTETEDIFEFPDMNDLHIIRDGIDAKIAVNTNAISTLSSGYATLLADLNSEKKKVKTLEKTVENLTKAAQGTIYDDITDDRTLHSKTLGDAEICGSNTTVLPNGELLSVGGRTVVWNQLIKNGNFADNSVWAWGSLSTNGISTSVSGNKAILTVSVSDYPLAVSLSQHGFNGIAGHKYYTSCVAKCSSATTKTFVTFAGSSSSGADVSLSAGVERKISGIITATESNTNTSWRIYLDYSTRHNIGDVFEVSNVIVVDLTVMFGSGSEPATVDAFEALIDTSVYHPYNSGTLMSLPTKQVVTQGKNLVSSDSVFEKVSAYNIYKVQNGIYGLRLALKTGKSIPTGVGIGIGGYKSISSNPSCTWALSTDGTLKNGGVSVYNSSDTYWYGFGLSVYPATNEAIEKIFNSFDVMFTRVATDSISSVPSYSPYCRLTLDLRQFASLPGYGVEGNVIDFEAKTYTQTKAIVDGELTDLDTPVVTDITTLLANFDETLPKLETGGTVTFVADGTAPDGTVVLSADEQSIPVPNSIAYMVKLSGTDADAEADATA